MTDDDPYTSPELADAFDALDARNAEAERIVRALAGVDPEVVVSADRGSRVLCGLCGQRGDIEVDHHPSCPWIRAREWADEE